MNYFKILIAGMATAAIFAVSASTVNASASQDCLDAKDTDNYKTSLTRGSGTISTVDGKPLCESADLYLQSFQLPDTWDGKGWNRTAIPQTLHAAIPFTIPAGEANFKKTIQIDVPDVCHATQLDFYFAPKVPAIIDFHDGEDRELYGQIFKATGKCEEPKPEPKPQKITCKSVQLVTDKAKRNVKVSVTGTAENTTISGYKVDFGDGTIANQQTAEHTYNKYGKFNITAYVSGKVNDKATEVTSDACKSTVEFTEAPVVTPPTTPEQPKPTPQPQPEQPGKEVETPEVLPNTGVGSVVTIFGVTSALGAGIHYFRSRFNR